MRWQGRRDNNNIDEDRRDESAGPTIRGPGFRLPGGKGGILLLAVVILASYYGADLTGVITGQPVGSPSQPRAVSPQEDEAAKFTRVIFATTDDTWGPIFEKMGRHYSPPELVMYRNQVTTGCGAGQAVMGPFYCPADGKVYIDLSFYDEMKHKLGADGDFAQGYVIAHEVGHHVQKLLGGQDNMRQREQHAPKDGVDDTPVRMELQADCYAGIWGHNMQQQGVLVASDLAAAVDAAAAVGDDRLQQHKGQMISDSFTHGTSAQRYTWFRRGMDSGDVAQCDTFSGAL